MSSLNRTAPRSLVSLPVLVPGPHYLETLGGALVVGGPDDWRELGTAGELAKPAKPGLFDPVYSFVAGKTFHVEERVVTAFAENVLSERIELVLVRIVESCASGRILRVDVRAAAQEHLEHLLAVLLRSDDDERVAMCVPVLDGDLLVETFFYTVTMAQFAAYKAQIFKLRKDVGVCRGGLARLGKEPVLGAHCRIWRHILFTLKRAHGRLENVRDQNAVVAQSLERHWFVADPACWVHHTNDRRATCRIYDGIDSALYPRFDKTRTHRDLWR